MAEVQCANPDCNKKIPVTEGHVVAMDKHWCTGCWKCCSCSKQLSTTDKFFRVDNVPKCEDCYKRDGNACGAPSCGKPLQGKIVTALGKKYCRDCFQCSKCPAKLADKEFYPTHDNKEIPECKDCHAKNSGYVCPVCGQGIAGKWTVVSGTRYHPECFKCKICTHPMGDKQFYTEGGKDDKPVTFTCADCYKRESAPECHGCHNKIVDKAIIKSSFGSYCSDCWKCAHCQVTFPQHSSVYDVHGEPRCEKCKNVA